MKRLLSPAPHEFHANLLYEGLDIYYGVVAASQNHNGETIVRTEIDGEDYRVTFQYEASGIEALNYHTCQLETIREYRLNRECLDGSGESSGSFCISSRIPDAESASYKTYSSPPGFEGVNVTAKGSNLPFEQYPRLLRGAIAAVGIDAAHFQQPHRHSNVVDAALYVRVQRGKSGPIHAIDGPIVSLRSWRAG